MSAVKNYFERAREVERLRKERAIQRANKVQDKVEVVVDTTREDNLLKEEINCIDGLLYRDWFTEDCEIIELLEDATEKAFNHVLDNLKSYSSRIQRVVNEKYNPIKFGRREIVELTDLDMVKKYMKEDQEFDKELETAWQNYIKESGISRPDGDLEDALEEKCEELDKQKKMLEEEKNKKSKTYITPSMRNVKVANPVVTKLEEIVSNLENEIVKLKKQIVEKEKSWYEERKLQFSNKWMSLPIVS